MGRIGAKASNRKDRERDGCRAGNASRRVEGLRRRFAKFRREHEPRTRIPESLRNAALAAQRSGISESEVRRSCGATSDQLARWHKRQEASARAHELDGLQPRVFPVVDDLPNMSIAEAEDPARQDLELRMGGWAICIRPMEAS